MNPPDSHSGARFLRGCLILSLVISALSVRSQAVQPSGQNAASGQESGGRERPSFSAAGVQGATAPPGYSSGLSREETSTVMTGVMDLNHEILSGLLPDEPEENCQQEPQLLRSARADPAAFAPNHALGAFYFSHGDTARSISYLEAANRARPEDIGNTRVLALALLGTSRNSEAIEVLERAGGSAGPAPALLRLLAFAYQLSGDRQKSVQACQRALAAAPDDVGNEFGCGIGLIAEGAPEAAEKLFTSATIAHPAAAQLWLGLGLVQDLERQKTGAVESLLRAVATNPEYTPPYFFLAGLADASPGRAAEIRNRLAEFVVAHPDSAEAHYNYALALWKQQRTDPKAASTAEIESQLKLALARDPKMARAHFQLGVVYADADDFVNAEGELLQALKLEPDNAEVHYRLAQAYKRNQKPELASAEMHRFLALHGTNGTDEDRPEARLRDLGPALLRQIRTSPRCAADSRQQP